MPSAFIAMVKPEVIDDVRAYDWAEAIAWSVLEREIYIDVTDGSTHYHANYVSLIGLMLLHKQCVSIRTAFIDGSTSMGGNIISYREEQEATKGAFACKNCVVQSNKLKEDDWFITYKDKTYLCVDCSYEMGENEHET